MKYIIIGVDHINHTSWVLHGIYTRKIDADNSAEQHNRQEIHPEIYNYIVVEIATKELELFRDYAETQAAPVGQQISPNGSIRDINLEEFRNGQLWQVPDVKVRRED